MNTGLYSATFVTTKRFARLPLKKLSIAIRFAVAGILIPAALSACVNYHGIGSDKKIQDSIQLDSAQSLRGEPGPWPTQNWWENFNDSQLNALIEEGLARSPQLAEAAARVAAANAALENSQASLLPNLNAGAEATYQRYTENGLYPAPLAGAFKSSGDIRLQAKYEVDFWGRNRAAVAAARSQQQAAQAEAASARVMLASAIAKTYFQLGQWQAFHRVGDNALLQRERIVELTQQRVDAGLDTQVELKQAQTQLPMTRAALAQLDETIVNTQHALAALLGAGPDRGLSIAVPVADENEKSNAAIVARSPANLPVELLGHRPDIVAARWRVEAALHNTDAGKAAFYPNVNLAAFAGYSSIGLDKLIQSGSVVYGAGPALSLPLFDGGRLRAHLKADYAAYDSAVANYDQTLITALRDVADQLNSYRALQPQMQEQHTALTSARAALDLALQRYHAGLGNYLSVLNAESAVFSQQLFAAQLNARAFTLRAELVRALGGGFVDAALQSPAPQNPSMQNSSSQKLSLKKSSLKRSDAMAQVSGARNE